MSVISLEFSVWENDLCLRNAAFEIGNEAKKSENPDIKIENIPGKTFLHMLHQRKPIKMRSSTGHEISLSADEIMQSFCN